MSKLKLWKSFSLFMVLLLMLSLVAVVPARPVQANVSSITVNPYDTRIIGANTGYRITMATGASLNAGNTITVVFPSDTGVPNFSGTPGNVFVYIPCTTVAVSGREVTVTIPAIAPIAPGQQFTVTFNKDCGITNPTTSGSKTVTVWTSVEATHITSSPYEITAVKVYTGATAHSENATITGAIAAAIAGDIIKVPDGTYNAATGETFPLNVDKANLTIQSTSGAATTIISPLSSNLAGFNVTAAGATIGGSGKGFTILPGGRGGIYANATGGNGITIQGCVFKSDTDGERRGMWFENLTNNALITGNSFATPRLGTGIQVINADGATISNNTVAAGTLKYCFLTFKAEAFYPDRNLSTPYAEYVATSPSTINNVTVTGNSVTGIGAMSESRQAIRFAASTKHSDHGEPQAQDLTVDTGGVAISGNTFTNNNGQAVKIDANTPAPDAGGQIAHISGVGNIHINNNNFSANTIMGVDNGQVTTVDAKKNYWRHALGPSHDGLNYGDNVTANITFRPWLVNTATGTPPAGEITISTTSPLPPGNTGAPYSQIFSATNGSGPYTWAYYSGTLPTGLSLVGNNLSGTPTVINLSGFNFAVQVSDGTQATYHDFTMSVSGGTLVITTTSPLSGGTINVPYGPVQLQAMGGDGSYTWSKESGNLPTGLSLGPSNGRITGTPIAPGTFNFNIRVVSASILQDYKDLSITISAPPTAGPKLIGADDAVCSGPAGAGNLCMCRFLPTQSDNMTQFKLKASAPGSVKVAVYSDITGSPGTRLNAVNTSTPVVAGWNTITFPSTPLTTSSYYWLAFNSSVNCVCYNTSGGTFLYKALAYTSDLPASAGTGLSSAGLLGLLAGWSAGVTPFPPTVTNSSGASSIAVNSARLNGAITDTGSENPTVIVYWGDHDGMQDPYSWDNSVNLGTKGAVAFSTDITGLNANTNYYYNCFAANSGGSNWADTNGAPFHTSALAAPAVTNSTGASSITVTSARLNGAITNTGGENPTAIIYWGDNDGIMNPYNWDNSVNLGTMGAVAFYTDITDLNLGTKYYYRCLASNSVGGAWAASSENFTTLSGGVAQKLIGADDATCSGPTGAGNLCMCRFQATQSGDMTQFKLKTSASGNVKVALYADSSGSPGALLNAVNTSTPVVAGWNTITFPSTALISGNYYWLAFNSSVNCVCYNNSGGTFLYKALAYTSDLPASAGTGLSSAGLLGLLAGWSDVVITQPVAPTLVTPKTTVTFEWSAASGATKYRLQVNTASDFTGTVIFDNAAISITSQAVALPVGGTYYWRVKAGNSGGWSGWSAIGSVTP